MENRLALVIAVDGLRASALGTYGNTSFSTQYLDTLASRSLVVEWLLATSPTLQSFYDDAFPRLRNEYACGRLFTDDPAVAKRVPAGLFAEIVATDAGREQTAVSVDATHAAGFFAHAVEQLTLCQREAVAKGSNCLLWIHFSGLCGPWDAPLAMRAELLDEDDPPAPAFVAPPGALCGVVEPDELLGYRVAYAAQVSVIELGLAGLLTAYDELPFPGKKLAMIVGSRGFALGEHDCVGFACQSLYSEQLHVPWLLTADQMSEPLARVPGFALPVDIGRTLADWLSAAETDPGGLSLVPMLEGASGHLRDVVIAVKDDRERIVRTPAWMLKQGEQTELYVKPDDRWEVNDIASRCPEIIDHFRAYLDAAMTGHPQALPEELLTQWR